MAHADAPRHSPRTSGPADLSSRARLTALRALASAREVLEQVGWTGLSDRHLRQVCDIPLANPDRSALSDLRAETDALILSGNWAGLLDRLTAWDAARATLPCGRRKAGVAGKVALSRLRAGMARGADDRARPSALDLIASGTKGAGGNPVAVALAARAHLDAARTAHPAQAEAHRRQASDLLEPFDAAETGLPLMARALYALACAEASAPENIPLAHDDWADLDPSDPEVWQTHATTMAAMPGDWSRAIAAAAMRCEWQTGRWWGMGGYALLLMPVLDGDPRLWDRIDPDRLVAASLDLARRRRKDQAAVNRIAAGLDRLCHDAPSALRPLLRCGRRQLLEESLNTLVPAAWGLGEPALRRRIAAAFLPELRAGARLRSTGTGLALCDPSAA